MEFGRRVGYVVFSKQEWDKISDCSTGQTPGFYLKGNEVTIRRRSITLVG